MSYTTFNACLPLTSIPSVWTRSRPHSTLFSDNRYLRMLNQARVLEQTALELAGLSASELPNQSSLLADLQASHLFAAETLRRLVIQHRGLPTQPSSLPGNWIKRTLTMSRRLNADLRWKATSLSLRHLERRLIRKYEALQNIAPVADGVILQELLHTRMTNLRELSSLRENQ